MLPTKFHFIWSSGFRGENYKKLANQKKELYMVAMFVNELGRNEQFLQKTFDRCFLPSFTSFGCGISEKIKMWKVNGRQSPSDGKSSHCLWQGELTRGDLYIEYEDVLETCFIILESYRDLTLAKSHLWSLKNSSFLYHLGITSIIVNG